MTAVLIPNSVTEIDDYAFNGCNGIKRSAYPNTIKKPFLDNITSFSYDPDEAITEDGWLYGPNKKEILYAPNNLEGECTIPETVTAIGNSAFSFCTELTKVVIPASITKIEGKTFYGCTKLADITIPNSVIEIGHEAFYSCDLRKVEFPNSVKKIAFGAFEYCGNITDITVPNSVTEIGSSAFLSCKGLTSITIPESVTEIGYRAFAECSNITEINYITDNPIKAEKNIFDDNIYSSSTLFVKPEALDKIENCLPWSYFDNIETKNFAGLEDVIYDSERGIDFNAPYEIYNLNGMRISESIDLLSTGIYIIRQGNKVKKIAIK